MSFFGAVCLFALVFVFIPAMAEIRPKVNSTTQFINGVLIPLAIIAAFFYALVG